jgi:16S rRNA (uracil1498-N3)-methyltransferase
MHQIYQSGNLLLFVNCSVHYFYSNISVQEGLWQLMEEEWRHIKALRVKPGEHVVLTDGEGGRCVMSFQLNNKIPSLDLLQVLPFENSPKSLTVGIPMTQDVDRIEWLIEKAVELGVLKIQLIQTEWSIPVKFSMDRLRKIAVSAMKQSQRSWLAKIGEIMPLDIFVQQNQNAKVYFAHCYQEQKQDWSLVQSSNHDILLIGPEGDFSEKEVKYLLSQNATPISLGSFRLRTETAALAAVAQYYFSK